MFGLVKAHQVAKDLSYMRIMIANVCFIGSSSRWVLVDAGLPGSTQKIITAAEKLYGEGIPPQAIILTHGHFDHTGAAKDLAQHWNVMTFAHSLEMPYLTGRTSYPPPDPSVSSGLLAKASGLYPRGPVDLGHFAATLPADGSVPGLPDWHWLHTPGHTPGHISLFRSSDGVLIAGDAFTTVKQESALAVALQDEELHGPPAYYTTDWKAAQESVSKLEALKPALAVTGHGKPMSGRTFQHQLKKLRSDFERYAVPDQGRYVD